jgi:far upstream element-binding protein
MNQPFIVRVCVPNDKVGLIIGKGGITIKTIQERSRTQIQIPSEPDADNPALRTLTIGADSKAAVDNAQQEITIALQQNSDERMAALGMGGASGMYGGAGETAPFYLVIPDEKVGVIIGKAGITIKEIQSRTRVKIVIPQAADPGTYPSVRTCSILGTADAQNQAKLEIERVLAASDQPGYNAGIQNMSAGGSMYGPGGGGGGGGGGNPYGGGGNPYQQQQPQQQYGNPYQQQQQPYGQPQQQQYGQQQPYGQPQQQQYAPPQQQQQQQYAPQQQQQQQYSQQPPHQQYAYEEPKQAAAPAEASQDPTAYYTDFWLYASYYGESAARVYYNHWSPPEGTPPPAGTTLPSKDDQPGSRNQSSPRVTQTNQAPSGNGNSGTSAADAAWEAYKIQYQEWYQAHGKASGADPNPPRPA